MAWKIRSITGSRRLDENMRLEGTRVVVFTVDNPTDPKVPLGPFTVELPAALSEAEMREQLNAEAAKLTALAQGG